MVFRKDSHNGNGDRSHQQGKSRQAKSQPRKSPEGSPQTNLFDKNKLNRSSKKRESKTVKNLKEKQPLNWIPGAIGTLFAVLVPITWNWIASNQSANQYRQGLVKDYVESIKGLLLDYYHKTGNFPEIKVAEVQSFVKSKTAATLKALNSDVIDDQQTTVLINFLRESGVGFIAYEAEQSNTPQDICSEDSVSLKNLLKTIDFSRFLCSIDLAKVKLNKSDLHLIILEKANLYQAELHEVNLLNADLERANLSQSKLMGTDLTLANLREAILTSANLENTNLSRANLAGANMASEMLKYDPAIGKTITTPKTILINAILEGTNLMSATLNKVDLSGANLKPFGLQVEKIEQERLNLNNPNKSEKKETPPLIPVNLRNADLSEANLSSADLTMANLRGANLKGAIIDNKTQFKSAIYDQYTCFSSFQKNIHLKLGNPSSPLWIESLFKLPIFQSNFNPSKYKMLFIRTLYKDDSLKKKYEQSNCEEKLNLKKRTPLNFIRADLRGADLRDADLRNVNLKGANLLGADLRGADLSGSQVDTFTNLRNAIYDEYTKLPSLPQLDEKDKVSMLKIMLGANLLPGIQSVQNQTVQNKKIEGLLVNNLISDIQQEKLSKARMWEIKPGTNLAVLTGLGADLSGQDLTGVDLQGSQLQNANLANVQIDRWTKLDGATYDQHTILPFSQVEAISRKMVYKPHQDESKKGLKDKEGKPIDLQEKTLEGKDFTQTDLSNAQLQKVNLTNAILLRSILSGAHLEEADLTQAILKRAKLNSAHLEGADLTGADLRWADLKGAKLTGADLTCADLRWATNINVKGTKNLDTANITGAIDPTGKPLNPTVAPLKGKKPANTTPMSKQELSNFCKDMKDNQNK